MKVSTPTNLSPLSLSRSTSNPAVSASSPCLSRMSSIRFKAKAKALFSSQRNKSFSMIGDDVPRTRKSSTMKEKMRKILALKRQETVSTDDTHTLEVMSHSSADGHPCNKTLSPRRNLSIEEVYAGVHDGKILGTGASGVVRAVTHRDTGRRYAVKCVALDQIENAAAAKRFREEMYIMCQIDHENIIRLEEVYESVRGVEGEGGGAAVVYLVMELCNGGELFERLDDQPDYCYDEDRCRRLVQQMLESVKYLHSKGIIHRDLKLENFLFIQDDDNVERNTLKLIDFGLSKFYKVGEVSNELVGTPYTVSPELLCRKYDEKCDVWAIGVITYLLLSGETPFGGCDRDGAPINFALLRRNILRAKVSFEPYQIWSYVSTQAKEFICTLLAQKAEDRPSAAEALKHPWFSGQMEEEVDPDALHPEVIRALRMFKEHDPITRMMRKVCSLALYPFWFADYRDEFLKLAPTGQGLSAEVDFTTFKTSLSTSKAKVPENEVREAFDALCIRDGTSTFQRHDFYAAGLHDCDIDLSSMCYAFDRIDVGSKGYITSEDIVKMLGSDGVCSKEALSRMYLPCLKQVRKMKKSLSRDRFLSMVRGYQY